MNRALAHPAPTLDVGRWMWWPSALSERHNRVQPPATGPGLEPALAGR